MVQKSLHGKKFHRKFLNPPRTIVLGFLAMILVGAMLLMLPISNKNGYSLSFINALFTATSAVCVTGLVVVETAVHFTIFGQLVILILIQFGGLGFMSMTTIVFLMIGKKLSLKDKLNIQEAISSNNLKNVSNIIKQIVCTTLIIELIGAVVLAIAFIPTLGWGKGIYSGIFHSISAFCNAGFDVLGTIGTEGWSLTPFQNNIVILMGVMSLIVLGGLGFSVIKEVVTVRRWSKISIYAKIVLSVSGILIVVFALFFLIMEYNNPLTIGNMNFVDKVANSFFQSITPRTAGYATFSQEHLTQPSKIITTLLMFIGASPASTGGGIKTTTFFVIFLASVRKIKNQEEILIGNKSITPKTAFKAFSIMLFALSIIAVLIFGISVVETLNGKTIPLEAIIFEAVSAFSTVGLSLGITAELSSISKLLLSITMFIGRIGPFTLGLAIAGKINNKYVHIKHQEAKIIIG